MSFLSKQSLLALLPLWGTKAYDATCLVPSNKTETLAQIVTYFIETDKDLKVIDVFFKIYFTISPYDLEQEEKVICEQVQFRQLTYGDQVCQNLTCGTK